MRTPGRWWLIIAVLLVFDLYDFTVIRFLLHPASGNLRVLVFSIYWMISLAAIAVVVLFPFLRYFQKHPFVRNYVFAILIGLFFAEVISSVFFLLDDLRRLIILVGGLLFPHPGSATNTGNDRSVFLSWLGIGLGSSLFVTLLYGFSNKYNYQVKKVPLHFENLPAGFRGLKIIQISDIHSGSFTNKKAVAAGIDHILRLEADLILFTGDLVNDRADEMKNYMDVFSRVRAPLGVYSVLGNHDYGDYASWPSLEAKEDNLERLKRIHGELGWRLLMNEHVVLEKSQDRIALIGIENWSASSRFPKHGRMDQAYNGAEIFDFKILMSHDPSHWDAQVRKEYPGIDLTLSGHTHGMQFGIEISRFKWSPVQWMYKQWAGLYEKEHQKLYVNRGYGFIGYPGRVGILPEITLIELL